MPAELEKNFAVRLPSEAEWEKAARGGLKIPQSLIITMFSEFDAEPEINEFKENLNPKRKVPWGNVPNADKPNLECAQTFDGIGFNFTTPVGALPRGISPYGCLDMIGNVWEWTISLWGKNISQPDFRYPYVTNDGREKLSELDHISRVLRGGCNLCFDRTCSTRFGHPPSYRLDCFGLRVVFAPLL